MSLKNKRKLIRKTLLFVSLGICLAFVASTQPAFAQTSGSATLRGVVRDSSGAVVSGAAVTVTSESTGSVRQGKTNDEGVYVFSSLSPGSYGVKVELGGFKISESKGVNLSPSDTHPLDVTLEVGAPTDVVTVQAAPIDQLQTETGSKENTITAKQIDNTSIIGRSALELLRILPGVSAPSPDDAANQSVSFGGGTNANNAYHVNGLRGENNNVSIDGSRVIDIGANNGTIITANVDMVQEVKVQSSNYAAEHGSSGVQITATTKGGGRDFHGTVYTYVRDAALNANDRSNTTLGVAKPAETYRYPGGNIGGPILLPWTKFNRGRDKLFFFYGLEIQRQQVDPGSRFDVVPTADMRKGIFPGLDVRNRIDPVGQALINLYPLPNFTDPNGGRNNYASSGLQPINRNQQNLRVDYSISNDTKLFVRWAREYETNDFARGLWWQPSSYELPSHVQGLNLGRSMVANLTNVINPTMTNEFVFSFSKLKLDNNYADPSKVSLKALGIPGFAGPFGASKNGYAPIALITSWGGQTSGDFWEPGGLPLFAHNSSLSFNDNLSKIAGAHTLKAGAFLERANKIQDNSNDQENRFIYAPWGNGSTGNEFADILVGRPAQVTQSTNNIVGNFRLWNYEFYVQDGWKIRPNFTLEYGLRVAYYPTNRELGGLGVLFDKSAYDPKQGVLLNGDKNSPNGFLQASKGQIPLGVTDNPAPVLAPRLNFAWDINGKGDTVIRGGAGIFYNRVQGNYQYYSISQPPNQYSATFDAYGFGSLGGTGLTYSTLPLINPFAQFGSIGISSANTSSISIPRVANMSLSVARRLPGSNILEVSYVGTEGRHLPDIIESNFVPVGALLSGHIGNANLANPVERTAVAGQASIISQFRPFPAYSNIKLNEYNGTSSYHSLQVTLSHQSSSRFQYFATYTFSKALGTSQTNETDGNGTDPIDTRNRNWGVLPYDRTHIFNFTYNYNVPDLARGGFRNWLTNGVLNGWQMSGITTFQSGLPIKLKFSGDITGAGIAAAWVGTDAFSQAGTSTGAIAPVLAGNPQINGGQSLGSKFMDINQISIPSFGNSGPYVSPFYLRSPHRWNHDVTMFKNFQITERQKIQFRAGFFNLFNMASPRFFQGDFVNSDVNVKLNTVCNVHVNGVPNGTGGTSDNICDPSQGFHFDADTINNFGKVINKHGHRIIEFALKYYF